MADGSLVVDGKIKFREGKKWKPRWCILKKLSPVADRLQVILYKDVTESRRAEAKPKSVFALDGFFGLNTGFCYDREPYVMAILCQKSISLMAFECRDDMIQFEINIRQSLGEEHQFPVKVVKAPSACRLPKDKMSLMIHDGRICLVVLSPPKVLMIWNIDDLRRFGAQSGKFCFEGGERCGKGSGMFAFQSEQAEDIADIVHLASTGKTSNCHRKFKNRSSQIDFGSHLIADLSSSSSSSIHHPNPNNGTGGRAPTQGALPVNLNCCNDNQSNSADSEDWSWYKRHSVSVMDHRRIAALRESRHLDNTDQFTVGVYDVPPNNSLVVESHRNIAGEPLYDSPRSNLIDAAALGLGADNSGHYKKIVPRNKEGGSSHPAEGKSKNIKNHQSCSGKASDKEKSALPEVNISDESTHEASLQRLKKQESDLQREMVLLDELLKNCAAKSRDLSSQSFDSAGTLTKPDHHASNNCRQNESEPLDQTVLAALDNDFTIISGNVAPVRPKQDNFARTSAHQLNTSLPERTPISPLFQAKLNRIPTASSWNRPLPYVNLSKYDDESYSHVHLPGSADCVPSSVHSRGAQGLLGGKVHSSSLSSLPVPASSMSVQKNLNRSYSRDSHGGGLQLPSRPCQLGQYPQRRMNTVEEQEVLVVDLNGPSSLPEETTYATIQSPPSNESQSNHVAQSSELINILTTDSQSDQQLANNSISDEVLYENIPALRESPPPPQLPPKGPALLKKLRGDAKVTDRDQTKNQRASSGNVLSGPSQYNSPKTLSLEEMSEKHCGDKEGNYLMMGSPKLQSKHLTDSSHTSRGTSSLKNPPARKGNGGLTARDDYMDMASMNADSFHEDEIYLDESEDKTSRHRELYISEADLMLPLRAGGGKVPVESAYMDMSTVTLRKSSVAQSMEISSSHESDAVKDTYKCLQDMSKPQTPPPLTEPPPLPRARQTLPDAASPGGLDEVSSKSSARVYVKVKNTPAAHSHSVLGQEPPKPFPNLINFSKKMSNSRSTYINTTLDADQNLVPHETYVSKEVLLPEPVKEGFLARFKRRSSKEKSSSPSAEKPGNGKHRNSVLERSMSEHDSSKSTREDKVTRLKVGRRRSSSFPNRLSYQESVDGTSEGSVQELPNTPTRRTSSTSSARGEASAGDPFDSSSSIHGHSSESDVSPLIRRSKKLVSESQYATVMFVSSNSPSANPFNQDPSMPYVKPSKQDSSKTDDEKLIEMMQGESSAKKTVIYQRSSSLELKKLNKSADHVQYLKVPKSSSSKERRRSFEKLFNLGFRNSSSPGIHKLSAQDISLPLSVVSTSFNSNRNDSSLTVQPPSESPYSTMSEDLPPSLPPKTRAYQSLLTPVSETAASGFPAQPEPIYVEMDEVVSRFRDRQISQTQSLPRETHSLPSESLSPGSSWRSLGKDRRSETKAGRESENAIEDPDSEGNPTVVTVPVDIPFADINEIEFSFGSNTSFSMAHASRRLSQEALQVDSVYKCVSPAKSVLRPRTGAEYAVIERRPLSSAFFGLPVASQDSPHENRIFNFDLGPTAGFPVSFKHSKSQAAASPWCPVAMAAKPQGMVHASLSRSHCSVEALQPRSPSVSMTSKSLVSLPEESPGTETWCNMHGSTVLTRPAHTCSISPAPSPRHLAKSERTTHPVSPAHLKAKTNQELFFFPIDEPLNGANSPSPRHHRSSRKSCSPNVPSPIYVNQEFIDKHHSNQQRNTPSCAGPSTQTSASPIRTGRMHSLMSLFFKDSSSSKHNSQSESQAVLYRRSSTRSGLSESEAIKIEKKPFKINHSRSLTLPHSKTNAYLSLPGGLHASHKEVGFKDRVRQERVLPVSNSASRSQARLNGREYTNFAESSIISRRRLQQAQSEAGLAGSDLLTGQKQPRDRSKPLPVHTKSSGYKNIDCFGAAIAIAPSSAHPPLSQPYSASESQPNLMDHMNPVSERLLVCEGTTPTHIHSTPLLPPSPPPPLPLRRRRPSSPSSPGLERTSSEISSDSAPSYFAPSPPSSPTRSDLPPLPPRLFPPAPRRVHTPSPRTPMEAHHPASPNSSEDLNQQELNYILVDMTDTAKPIPEPEPPTPPVAYHRRSKRARQQKLEQDSAKSSYALIDFTVTKALEKAGQEHRDDSLRRASGQLNRMNSVPSSHGRKPLSVVPRERKLSSGSIESC